MDAEAQSIDALIAASEAPPVEEAPTTDTPPVEAEGAPASEETPSPEETPAPVEAEAAKEPEAKPQDDIAQRASALMKKEGEIVRRQQALRQQEKDIEGARQAAKEYESLKALAAENPLALIEKLGVKIDDVKARIAEAESTDPNAVLRRKVEAIERQREEEAARAKQEAEQRQVADNVARHKREIADFVGQNAEKFELVAAFGDEAVDMVQQTIIRHLQRTQELLSPEQATELVEQYLEKNRVEPVLKAKKVASRFKPAEAPKTPAPAPRTLDNGMTSTPTVRDDDGIQPGESPDDYFQRILQKNGLR